MEEIRYIQNPFAKIFNIVNPDTNQLYNLLLKLLNEFFQHIHLPTVIALASKPAKSRQDCSAYTGSAGYLFMLIKAHDFFMKLEDNSEEFTSRSHIIGDEGVNKLTDPKFYLKMAQEQYLCLEKHLLGKPKTRDCYSFFISDVSVWVCGMHLAYRTRNVPLFRQNQMRVIQCFEGLNSHIDKQYWQLLYGVPGFLYAILELQKSYDNEEEVFKTNFGAMAVQVTHMILKQGIKNYERISNSRVSMDKLPEDFRLVYYFHKKEYLGGAHGLGGNISVILSAIRYNNFGPDLHNIISLLKTSISFLLKHLINGNFSTSAASKNIKLVHFCHGAPGIVTALSKFYEMFPEIGISLGLKEVIDTNLNHIWKYGVLKKGFGLCHGISGNAYAFISPSIQNVFHERTAQLLKKAQFFALLHEQPDVLKEIRQYAFADRMVVGQSDQPYSLMVGIAGDICFTMDVLKGSGYFPGYDI